MTNMVEKKLTSFWHRSGFFCIIVLDCISLTRSHTYCADENAKCPKGEYCDSGYSYCMPCNLICHGGPMQHDGECREKCPDSKATKGSVDSQTPLLEPELTHAPQAALLKGGKSSSGETISVPVLYVVAVSLVVLCIVSVLALACYVIRRRKRPGEHSQNIELGSMNTESQSPGLDVERGLIQSGPLGAQAEGMEKSLFLGGSTAEGDRRNDEPPEYSA